MKTVAAAGWHGKLPGVSDFASRRLDARFIDLWDGWISAGLARMRADEPERWIDAYLASPTWRFLVPPNFFPAPLSAGAWAGVVMPSVDRVGRYYPLTLTVTLDQVPQTADVQARLWCWLQSLQDTALRALDEDWPIDVLETQLHQVGLPLSDDNAALTDDPGSTTPSAHALQFFASAAAGSCAWYTDREGGPQVLQSRNCNDAICQLWE